MKTATFGPETLIVIDLTDLRKPYAQAMPYLATVRDGSTGQLAQACWCGVALACEPASRKVTPLLQQLWSAAAPDCHGNGAVRAIDAPRPNKIPSAYGEGG